MARPKVKAMKILGVSHSHDSAAALLLNGQVVADMQEERRSRVKNDASFPIRSILGCLEIANIQGQDIDVLAVPSEMGLTLEFGQYFPALRHKGFRSLHRKESARTKLKNLINRTGSKREAYFKSKWPEKSKVVELSPSIQVRLYDHHLCHAASSYFTRDFEGDSLVLVMDAIGDDTSISIWHGSKNSLTEIKRYGTRYSLGLFYSLMTEVLDWRHGSDEWKLMGLAPYGTDRIEIRDIIDRYCPKACDEGSLKEADRLEVYTYRDHGTYWFHCREADMLRERLRSYSREDIAATTQAMSEDIMLHVLESAISKTGLSNVCVSGGCFLNVKANGRLQEVESVKNLWVYPNPGDGGLAVGAAYLARAEVEKVQDYRNEIHGFYYGDSFKDNEIESILKNNKINYKYSTNLANEVARELADGLIVGWFQGRTESGPRALGCRSILMNAEDPDNKAIINRCVKYREGFRPFCPSMTEAAAKSVMNGYVNERHMCSSTYVKEGIEKLIPAVVHIDGSIRPQIVEEKDNPLYFSLLREYGLASKSGLELLLNTSFNVKGEPVVNSPEDALRCFFSTGIDLLAIGNYIVRKECKGD